MVNGKWGVAALVAGLALGSPAWAQSEGTSGSQMGTGGQRDPGSGSPRGSDTSSAADTGSMPGPGETSSATGSSATSKSAKPDKQLVTAAEKAHAANQAEIEMGKMAQEMGQAPDVKQYAEKLVADHQKNDAKLQTLAQTAGIDLTGKAFQDAQKKDQKAMKKLEGKHGADFDKAFISDMVSDHKHMVKDTEKAAKHARSKNQTELASYFEATHKGLQGHLQEAERIQKELKSGKGQAHSGMGAGETGTGSSGAAGMGGGTGGSSTGGAGTSGTGAAGAGGGTGGPGTGGTTGEKP
ncbi:MAG TPA: DUF4142 domain-containing protein [Anaeromyxobacter sp.]|nr:DUF4142 domain-containing protein [Anaeromyxobacter sp.]